VRLYEPLLTKLITNLERNHFTSNKGTIAISAEDLGVTISTWSRPSYCGDL